MADDEIPREFLCPLTKEVMRDPVTAADEYTYERFALEEWYQEHDTSPKTGLEVAHKDFTPNMVLQLNIEEWQSMRAAKGFEEVSETEESEGDEDVVDPQRSIDRQVLEDLYESTQGAACWENIDGWDEGHPDLAEWWGCTVSTSMDDELFPGMAKGSLVRVKLVENGLNGELPASLNNLKNLVILNLYKNMIEGPMPELSKLRNLMKLDLSRNRFTGEIPLSFAKLMRLEKLQLQNNLLTGPFPAEFCGMTALKYFDISRNDLTGKLPEDLGYMEPLKELCINDNQFTGLIPETLTLLTNLEKLTVQFNQFEIDPHWLLEYIPEECEFEADEEEICQVECLRKKQDLT